MYVCICMLYVTYVCMYICMYVRTYVHMYIHLEFLICVNLVCGDFYDLVIENLLFFIQAVDKARSLLERRTLVGPVSLSLPCTLWIDPIEERVVLNDVGVSTALGRPQTELVRVGVACKNPNHLMKLRSVLDMEISSEIESMKFDSCK